MVAFIVSLTIGVVQTILLNLLLKSAVGGKMKQLLLSFFAKFIVYALGFTALYFFFLDEIKFVAAGLIAGVVISFIGIAIKIKKNKTDNTEGDDADEHR